MLHSGMANTVSSDTTLISPCADCNPKPIHTPWHRLHPRSCAAHIQEGTPRPACHMGEPNKAAARETQPVMRAQLAVLLT